MTVRSYDRCMRDRFDEARGAAHILSEIASDGEVARARALITACFGRDIFAELRGSADDAHARIGALTQQYDMIVVAHIASGAADAGASESEQYFATMSCEGVDSYLWNICARMHARVEQIAEIITAIEDVRENGARDDSLADTMETYWLPSVRFSRVARASASAKKTLARAIPSGYSPRSAQRTNDGCTAQFMSSRWIARVLANNDVGTSSERADEISLLRRKLRCADERAVRAMTWARPICHRGADALRCEACSARVRILQDMSEAVCDRCGRIALILNPDADTDDAADAIATSAGAIDTAGSARVSTNTVGGARSRRGGGGYNYARHLKMWLDRLQAIEPHEFDPRDIARVRASVVSEVAREDLINWRALRCDDIARHLDLCGLSHLGDHIPKILKELGGRAPPILDYDSEQIIVRDFMHIMSVYAQLFREPGNKPYYAFFIAKIIKRRFRADAEVFRMLQYVSRQGHDTVNKNDRIYQQICDAAPAQYDLVFEPEVD